MCKITTELDQNQQHVKSTNSMIYYYNDTLVMYVHGIVYDSLEMMAMMMISSTSRTMLPTVMLATARVRALPFAPCNKVCCLLVISDS